MGTTSFPSYILNAPATEVTKLSNGLRVASEGGHGETATVGVFIDTGSRYETAKNNGVAHFLEHMAFKGTNKRTQHQLELEIENMGAHLNAYTSREQTVYYAKVLKEDVPRAVEILADILLNSKFEAGAIERERGVILREMQEIEQQEQEVVFDYLHETAFQGSGLGRTILGPEANVRSITRDNLTDYIKTHYTAPRMVVAGAGAVDQKQLVQLAEKHFGGVPTAPPKGLDVPHDKALFTGSDLRVRNDDKPQAHLAIAFRGAGWTDASSFPLMVMQSLLGTWDRGSAAGKNSASKLCQSVAELGLAHSVMAFNTSYKDTGLFGVYAVAEDKTLNDLSWHVMNNLVRLGYEVTDEEVARARTQLKASLLSHLDDTSSVCEDIGRSVLNYGRRLSPAEVFARIDAVDTDTVKATARHVVHDQDIAVAALGPVYEMPDYNWLRRRTYWVRY